MREDLKLDKTLSRQRPLQSCLLKSQKIKTKPKENITRQWIYYPKRINRLFQWDEFRYLFEKGTKQKNHKRNFKPLLGKQQNVVIVTKPTIQVTRAATSKTTHCIVVHTTQSKNSETKWGFRNCQSLWRRANARNVSFFTLYGGQFTFSTQLLTLNYLLYSPTGVAPLFL